METTILIFGDSITLGAFDYECGGWTIRLKKYFKNHEIYNLGVSGDTTNDLLKRFKLEVKTRKPRSNRPLVIIFAIGVNDSYYINSENNPGTTLKKFEKNLVELLNQAKNFTEKIIFVGPTKADESKTLPIPWAKNIYYTNENIIKYDSVIEKFCRENKVHFINTLDLLNKDKDLEDGLHPNSKGHQKIFKRVKEFLVSNKLIEK